MRIRVDRAGMTLVELLLAMTLFSLVLAAAVGTFQHESDVFRRGNDRLSTLQNQRYAVSQLSQDLEQAGAGVLPSQPSLVYGGSDVVAFNADYLSRNPSDISAVFVDPDAPAEAAMALTKPRRIQIPTTAFTYPDTTFVSSPAETIIFFFEPDDETDRPDDVALYRQANDLAPELVSRGLVPMEGRDFFEYRELVVSDTAPDAMMDVPSGALPLMHSVPTHLSVADTGAAGRIDRVRAVRVNAGVWNGRSGADERIEPISQTIWLRNVRQRVVLMCGDAPLEVSRPTVVLDSDAAGDPIVRVSWAASPDEVSGEGDVVRYLVWRRLSGSADWGDPYLSIPSSGGGPYQYVDSSVEPGERYDYAISSQDCTPSVSIRSGSASVSVPTI